jgi:hypothetical protein
MKNCLIVYLCLCLLAGCRQTDPEAQRRAALEARVLQVHDAAMARMDQVFSLRQKLKKQADSLQARQADAATLQLLEQHRALLQKADDGMMGWMHAYRAPEKDQHQVALKYLTGELHKITQVKKTMDSTLAAAQQIYEYHEPKK